MFKRKQYGLLLDGEVVEEGSLKEISKATGLRIRDLKSIFRNTFKSNFQVFEISKGITERQYYLLKETKKIIATLEKQYALDPDNFFLKVSLDSYNHVLQELESVIGHSEILKRLNDSLGNYYDL